MRMTGTWRREGPYIVFDTSPSSRSRHRPGGTRREMEFEFDFEGGGQPTIRRGSSGSAVRDAQSRLLQHGFSPGPVDGIFGSGTDAATRAFQRAKGLTVDGVIGPNTWAALTSAPRQAPPPSRSPSAPSPQPTPAPGSTGRGAKIVAEAIKHLGFQEGSNNDNPFSSHFGVNHVPWCCYFVSYCYTKAGVPLNHGSCSALLDYLVDRDKFFGTTPSPGDIVIFDWTLGDHDEAEHAGIVERVSRDSSGGTRVHTIEGNSGNGVNRREYAITSDSIVGFGRLP
jgi:Putative peptidoglycan binding domain/CHAP domain